MMAWGSVDKTHLRHLAHANKMTRGATVVTNCSYVFWINHVAFWINRILSRGALTQPRNNNLLLLFATGFLFLFVLPSPTLSTSSRYSAARANLLRIWLLELHMHILQWHIGERELGLLLPRRQLLILVGRHGETRIHSPHSRMTHVRGASTKRDDGGFGIDGEGGIC